jgi:hypothetical protein
MVISDLLTSVVTFDFGRPLWPHDAHRFSWIVPNAGGRLIRRAILVWLLWWDMPGAKSWQVWGSKSVSRYKGAIDFAAVPARLTPCPTLKAGVLKLCGVLDGAEPVPTRAVQSDASLRFFRRSGRFSCRLLRCSRPSHEWSSRFPLRYLCPRQPRRDRTT